jgi:DnaJ-class molecular chaperone
MAKPDKETLKTVYRVCPQCDGTGEIVTDTGNYPCTKCKGDGTILWGYMEKQ